MLLQWGSAVSDCKRYNHGFSQTSLLQKSLLYLIVHSSFLFSLSCTIFPKNTRIYLYWCHDSKKYLPYLCLWWYHKREWRLVTCTDSLHFKGILYPKCSVLSFMSELNLENYKLGVLFLFFTSPSVEILVIILRLRLRLKNVKRMW